MSNNTDTPPGKYRVCWRNNPNLALRIYLFLTIYFGFTLIIIKVDLNVFSIFTILWALFIVLYFTIDRILDVLDTTEEENSNTDIV